MHPALLDGGGSAASYREVVRSIDMPTSVARDTIDKAFADARHGRHRGQGSLEVVAYRLMSRGALPGDPARLLADVREANRESIDEAVAWLRLEGERFSTNAAASDATYGVFASARISAGHGVIEPFFGIHGVWWAKSATAYLDAAPQRELELPSTELWFLGGVTIEP